MRQLVLREYSRAVSIQEARKIAAAEAPHHRLPCHFVLDDAVLNAPIHSLAAHVVPADEWLVHTATGRFVPKEDILDEPNQTVFLAEHVPPAAFDEPGPVALLVTPQAVSGSTDFGVVMQGVHTLLNPQETRLLRMFDAAAYWWGRLGPIAQFPVITSKMELQQLPPNKQRAVLKTSCAGVRPIFRLLDDTSDRRIIRAFPCDVFGVLAVY